MRKILDRNIVKIAIPRRNGKGMQYHRDEDFGIRNVEAVAGGGGCAGKRRRFWNEANLTALTIQKWN